MFASLVAQDYPAGTAVVFRRAVFSVANVRLVADA